MHIRRYRPSDHDAIGDICVATGDSGGDARGKFVDDQLLAWVYAYPYLEFAPDLCWVVEDEGEVLGYIVGVENVESFSRWWAEKWTPRLEEAYPPSLPMDPASNRVREVGLHPERMAPSYRQAYPAELHIDLLPETQGRGVGTNMMQTFIAELMRRGIGGLAIGVGARNPGALAFYKRLGFEVLKTHVAEGKPVAYTLKLDLSEKPSSGKTGN